MIVGMYGKIMMMSFVVSVFVVGGLDLIFVIGGWLISVGVNVWFGMGDFIVVEVDELDVLFLNLYLVIEVIMNIDVDYMDIYGYDFVWFK